MSSPESPGAEPPDIPDEESPPGQHRGEAPFPVVGIGASAGGLEAIGELLANLPEGSGMAFVVVLHLDPDRESRLVELLDRTSRLPVAGGTPRQELAPRPGYRLPPQPALTPPRGGPPPPP